MGQILRNLKDPHSAQGVYKVPCLCEKMYIGEIERVVNFCVKKTSTSDWNTS